MSSTQGRVERLESSRSSSTTDGMVSKCLHYVKNFFERGPLGSWIFLMLCVISVSLDPLFFFTPVINDHKNCIALDKKLGVTACVLRSIIDFVYVIYIIISFLHAGFSTPYYTQYGVGNCNIVECVRTIGWKLLRLHVVDLFAVLPLPQVMIIIISATMTGSKILNAMKVLKFLKYFLFFQYVPRVIRIYSLFRKTTRTLGIFTEATWSKAAFNFFLYMVAGHVYGALWYFLAIEREIECWNNACKSHTICIHDSIDCNKSSRNHVFFNDFCSTDKKIYDFGIFYDAVQSGILGRRNFLHKFMYCFRWGLQSLSCFGQNLVTSTDFWENVFTISITVSSVLMFIFLIGNMQIYLQVETTRSEEMKLKLRDIEQWMPFKKLPPALQEKVKRYQQHVWRETKGIDVENLLNNLPKDLRKDIKRHLCFELLTQVPIFKKMDQQILDKLCDLLKPMLYMGKSYIVREGDPVDEMLFIVRGKLISMTTNGGRDAVCLKAGDFCGEELISWALDPKPLCNHPLSTRTIKAQSQVEAYGLMTDDVKFAASEFRRLYGKQLQHTFRFHSLRWRTWAARRIQAAWHEHCKNKCKESLRTGQDRLKHSLITASGSTPRFAANALCALRHRTTHTRKARIPGRAALLLLQKPDEPDFTDEEQ